jgi:3'-phosphoadenosine 5'-phosphosulfate sulfotransferase (PAPS reductase)/FAD synthetase
MSSEMNRCKRCSLPEGKFNVVLNASGICNYCDYFEQNKKTILDFTNRENILVRKFEKHRGKYEYDAIVGLSGGKDSTYVLCQMVDKYKLKVAAVTYDNGFLTDFARESIENTINKLGRPETV